jgi:hypothetical protein
LKLGCVYFGDQLHDLLQQQKKEKKRNDTLKFKMGHHVTCSAGFSYYCLQHVVDSHV